LTRRKEVVTEVKLVETNPAFRHVQECLNWIEAKQVNTQNSRWETLHKKLHTCCKNYNSINNTIYY